MAEPLRNGIRQKIIRVGLWLYVFALTPLASAEILADPTRPPATFSEVSEGSGAASASGPVLQSVLISPRRAVATISGQTVKVGDRIGDARVVRIAETEVVLRNGKDLQTLKLFPGIEKRLNASRASAKTDSRRQQR